MTTPRRVRLVDSPTEARNPRTVDIDQLSTEDILRTLNTEDATVAGAVTEVLGELAVAVEFAVATLRGGGRVHYVGAGTSGRLASLDAAELVPTFNIPEGWFVAHHAGGAQALSTAVEEAEDDAQAGTDAMRADAGACDFVLGLSASGHTPFVLGALRTARAAGARTGLISANPRGTDTTPVDVRITPDTGPEAIAGSTRMKAGTAQKLLLTSFSTTVLIRLGYTYSNLMVSMRATNAKLRGRTQRILGEATGLPAQQCAEALDRAGGDLKLALLHLLSGADTHAAHAALEQSEGHVRNALDRLRAG